jgi:mono/diheme cytochrome c family protein
MELPVHLGRIYRITHESTRPRKVEKLSSLTAAQLVEKLHDPNGWVRDTAQRLLVERNDRTILAALREVARAASPSRGTPEESSGNGDRPRAGGGEGLSVLATLHSLWTLDGLNALDRATLTKALESAPPVLSAAVRLSERALAGQAPDKPPIDVLTRVVNIATSSTDAKVRVQCAFTLSAVDHPHATGAVAALLAEAPEDRILRDAAMSGLAGRELDTLELLLADNSFATKAPGSEATLAALAGAVLKEGKPDRVEHLLTTCADDDEAPAWQQLAILSGMADVAKKLKDAAPANGVTFAAAPQAFLSLAESTNGRVSDLATTIAPLLHWPGKVDPKQKSAPPLTAAQQKLFDEGKVIFNATCAACHQAGGEGLEGKAPPLRGSPWVAGTESRLVRIVLNGVRGPIHVADSLINMEMPNLAVLDDRQVAAVLTYARREWGHTADPVDPETVAKLREQVKGRPDAWTEEELLKVK